MNIKELKSNLESISESNYDDVDGQLASEVCDAALIKIEALEAEIAALWNASIY